MTGWAGEPHKLSELGSSPRSATIICEEDMAKRGYIKDINGTFFWYDVNDNPHVVCEMDDNYVENCIKLLKGRITKAATRINVDSSNEQNYIKIFEEEKFRRAAINKTSVGRLLYV